MLGPPASTAVLAALSVVVALSGCASRGPAPVDGRDSTGPVPSGYYRIRRGDTLGGIAQSRGISTDKLVLWNRLEPPYTLYAGRLLRIAPQGAGTKASKSVGADRKSSRRLAAREARPRPKTRVAARSDPSVAAVGVGRRGSRSASSDLRWDWPIKGPVIQGFRVGDRTRQGLRIACRVGEQVRATAGGTVVYSGSGLKGYGNLIIVKHNDKYLSAYGFNRRLLVTEGSRVRRGQAVGECGQGPDGIYLLHFEVRREGAAVDPLLYLPPRA